MRTLADIQAGIRDAVVNGNAAAVAPVLMGGTHPERRLAIHRRHYMASLTRALVERFPATVWLVGSELLTHAVTSYVRERPPSRPCIAEYGDGFPGHLGSHPAAEPLRISLSSPNWNGISDAWRWPPRNPRTCSTSTWIGHSTS